MSFNAGSATSQYILDISQVRQAATELRNLFAGLRQEGAQLARVRAAPLAGGQQAVATQQQAERAILARARAEAQLVQVQNTGENALRGLTQAERIYADALAKVDQNSIAAVRAQTQLAAIQNRIASQAGGGLPVLPRTLESFGTQAIDQFKTGILGLVGPAAAVTAGFTLASKALQSFQDGFRLKAELDQTTASLRIQLQGVRDSANVFAEAAQFADQYKLTQQEVNQALSASVSILRNSTSSTQELLGVLSRLQVLSPEQGLQGAALAVKELASGDIQSLVERFEVSRSTANKMKEEIKGGADAVQVLSKYLDSAGVSMDALRARTEGSAGAQANLAQAQERFSLALGNLAASNGAVAGINALAQATNIYAQLLNGDGIQGVTRFAVEQEIARGKADAYNQALRDGKTEAEAAAIANNAAEVATRALSDAFGLAIPVSESFRSSLRGLAADASNAAAQLEGVRKASEFKGSIGARASDPSRGAALQAARDETASQAALRDQLLATGTAKQIIAIRQREYNAAVARYGASSAEAIKAQTLLIQAQRASISSARGTANQLANIARTSGDERLRIERENLERLRAQEEDFNVRRTRSQEDYEKRRRRLLAEGKRAEAARLAEEYATEQRRAQEDFNRQRARTIRDNAERAGDQADKTENRVLSATRGRGAALPSAGAAVPGGAIPDVPQTVAAGGAFNLRIQIAPTQIAIDGEKIIEVTWPVFEQRVTQELAAVGITVPPGSGQTVGVAGPRP